MRTLLLIAALFTACAGDDQQPVIRLQPDASAPAAWLCHDERACGDDVQTWSCIPTSGLDEAAAERQFVAACEVAVWGCRSVSVCRSYCVPVQDGCPE